MSDIPAESPPLDHQFVSQFITFSAGDLARHASEELLAAHPSVAQRYSPRPQDKWRENMSSRLIDLAAAMNAGRPEMFASQIAWTRAAFDARRVPTDDLKIGLEVLWSVVREAAPPEDRSIVDRYFEAGLRTLKGPGQSTPTTLRADTPLGRLGAAYLLAILEGDRRGASQVVLRAVQAGSLNLRDAYLGIFVPVLQELGRMWHMNEITVAEEHFATATTLMVMDQLLPLAPCKPPDGRIVLAASVEGNAHDLGVRFVGDFLELAGWRSIYLGSNVPTDDVVTGAQDFGVHLVALSATLPVQLRAVERTIEAIRRSDLQRKPRIMVGGRAFSDAPDLWTQIGADAFAFSADEAVRVADALVPPAAPPSTPR